VLTLADRKKVGLGSLADIEAPPCPLYPQKRTWLGTIVMSALCQKRTNGSAAKIRYSMISSARPDKGKGAWAYLARFHTSSAFPPDEVRATPKVKSSPASLIIDHF
jgi:hypothetical protein